MKRIHTTPPVHHTTHAEDPAKKHPHVKPHSDASAEVASVESAVTTPAPASATSPVPVVPAQPTAPAGLPTIAFIALPPTDANIPSPPKGWVARPGEDFRGIQPKSGELTNLEAAIADLQRFTNFAEVFGNTVPPLNQIIHLLQAGAEWSAMGVATAEWAVYSGGQEGLSWSAIRIVMALLRSAFDLAAQVNGNLTTMYPSLASFLAAQKVIARKGASTKAANKAAKAEGKPATHGKVGKARTKAAAKAALAAQGAEGATTPEPAVAAAPTVAGAASLPPTAPAPPAVAVPSPGH